MSLISKIILSILTLVLFIAGGACLLAFKFLSEPASSSGETVVFDVRPGETFKSVARRLQEQQLVSSAQKFELLARVTKSAGKVRVGEYAIRRNLKPRELLSVIASGKSIEYSITVQEGYNIFEISDLLGKQGIIKRDEFLKLTQDQAFVKELLGEDLSSLEGYLFPETYHITKFTGAKGLIKMMVDRFKENYARLSIPQDYQLNRHQIVTLASIVEKETGAPEERPIISSVFHNRLAKKMRLQTDPTVIYGVWEKSGVWNRNISRQDLTTPNRYNTYLNEGLPYGPISNPGFGALKAAISPAKTEFLFFVSRNDGTHIFSVDYAGHLRAVAQYQLDRKAREGKSWRDLKNRQSVPAAPTPGSVKPGASRSN